MKYSLSEILYLSLCKILTALLIPSARLVRFPMALATSLFFTEFKISAFSGMKDFSYGMYLVHYPAVLCIASFGVFGGNSAFAFLLVIALSFFCAYLLDCFQHMLERRKNIMEASE